jgi:hypothetical protein
MHVRARHEENLIFVIAESVTIVILTEPRPASQNIEFFVVIELSHKCPLPSLNPLNKPGTGFIPLSMSVVGSMFSGVGRWSQWGLVYGFCDGADTSDEAAL